MTVAQRNAEKRVELIRHVGGPLTPAEADAIREQCAWEDVDMLLDVLERSRKMPLRRFVFGWLVRWELRRALKWAFEYTSGERTVT